MRITTKYALLPKNQLLKDNEWVFSSLPAQSSKVTKKKLFGYGKKENEEKEWLRQYLRYVRNDYGEKRKGNVGTYVSTNTGAIKPRRAHTMNLSYWEKKNQGFLPISDKSKTNNRSTEYIPRQRENNSQMYAYY